MQVAPTCAWGVIMGWFDRFVKDLLMTVLHRMETGCLGHMQKHVDIECMQKSEHI